MKYLITALFTTLNLFAFGQFSLELTGNIGVDINQFETRYTNNRTPLTNEYTYNGNFREVEFTILEPRSIGGRFLWKFSDRLNLSVGVDGQYTHRDIIGTFYRSQQYNGAINELDINIRRIQFGLFLRKEIELNEHNRLFVQPGIYNKFSPQQSDRGSVWFYDELDEIPEKNRQLVKYEEDEDYYNLIEIFPNYGGLSPRRLAYQFTQGYMMDLTSKLGVGISSSFFVEVNGDLGVLIFGWDNDQQKKSFGYHPNTLKFRSVFFDLFFTYEF